MFVTGHLLPGFVVRHSLEARSHEVLLSDQQRPYLETLVGLMAGQLIRVADCLNLAIGALRRSLKLPQLRCIDLQVFLLTIEPLEHRFR